MKVVLELVVTVATILATNLVVVNNQEEDVVIVMVARVATSMAQEVVKVVMVRKEAMANEVAAMAKREATAQEVDHTLKFQFPHRSLTLKFSKVQEMLQTTPWLPTRCSR